MHYHFSFHSATSVSTRVIRVYEQRCSASSCTQRCDGIPQYYLGCHLHHSYKALCSFLPQLKRTLPQTNNNNPVNSFPRLEWAVTKTTNVIISNKRLPSSSLEAVRLFYPLYLCYLHFSRFCFIVLWESERKSDLVWMCSLSDSMIVMFS